MEIIDKSKFVKGFRHLVKMILMAHFIIVLMNLYKPIAVMGESLKGETYQPLNSSLEVSFSLTRYEAAKGILKIVTERSGSGNFIVFSLERPLYSGDKIFGSGNNSIVHQALNEEWFFWVDYAPGTKFPHQTDYIYVECSRGKIGIDAQMWQPALNGRVLWESKEAYWDYRNWIYSTLQIESECITGTK